MDDLRVAVKKIEKKNVHTRVLFKGRLVPDEFIFHQQASLVCDGKCASERAVLILRHLRLLDGAEGRKIFV